MQGMVLVREVGNPRVYSNDYYAYNPSVSYIRWGGKTNKNGVQVDNRPIRRVQPINLVNHISSPDSDLCLAYSMTFAIFAIFTVHIIGQSDIIMKT